MVTYIVRRLLYSIPVLIAASFLIFSFVALASDPLSFLRMQPRVDQTTIQKIIDREHLEDPIPVRYAYWAHDAVTNKFGNTLLGDRPIWPDLVRVMGNTAQLVIAAELIAILLAIFIGVYSAVRQYSAFDYSFTTFSFLGLATPVFWLALMLQVLVVNIFLTYDIRIFYVSNLSSADPDHFLLDRIQHLALPVTVLAVASIAQYSRYMRAAMLEVINSDYVRTARAKGLNERGVIMKHAFRNALIPLATVVALNLGALLGGAIVTETVFSLDGMGRYFVNNLVEGDPYPVMAWLMITSVLIVFFNLVADVVYGYLDPRVRYD
ncbi:MAG: peptide/nickel transport system permease protein [Gaiellaceae bacterium]|jgi:peptide/nickel transport system permease protein|nr:peptide/nickel transport system permease protein [Gaiellaceae bacterium]